ncbi:hypothetical protein LAZ40_04170 [Cereibacter sphaeroides]|uniref:hypothetical protein n=1 Tax=Cereibacter sphaeroides TaxID=1063 RepID=UPI001F1BC8A9|nr:hypothetical protein [Cereibacter sphaeroides]MCE6958250.1 hypothetical protein [Cereibacter sphaeroides]MCE6971122.1 hypothetical protein [Cereibacter sphaeroides]
MPDKLLVAARNFQSLAASVSEGRFVASEDVLKVIAIVRDHVPAEASPFPAYNEDHLLLIAGQFRRAFGAGDDRAARNFRTLLAGRPLQVTTIEHPAGGQDACTVTLADPGNAGSGTSASGPTPACATLAAALAFAAEDCVAAARAALAREEAAPAPGM